MSRHALTITVRSTNSDLTFNLTNIYGPATHMFADAFLDDLQVLAAQLSGPWFVVGDWNHTRDRANKNTAPFNFSLTDRFNLPLTTLTF
jgi:hypothetical protein